MVNQSLSLSPNPEYPHYDQTVSDCRGNMGGFFETGASGDCSSPET